MGVPELVDGHLPMGRWVSSPDEVEAAFVADDSGVRPDIWAEWTTLRDALRSAVGAIASCWMAGSFLSDKRSPNDIDCLWIIDADLWDRALNSGNPRLAAFLLNCAGNGVKSAYGMRIDSFVLEWFPTPGPNRPPDAESYYGHRGYWDNLWVRMRDSDSRLDSIPRRGYLEVILDGYR